MSEKLAARLRRHDLEAQRFFIGLRCDRSDYLGDKLRLAYPSNDGKLIYQLCKSVLETRWRGEALGQVQVTALDPRPAAQQIDIFMPSNEKKTRINDCVDGINTRFGEFKISPARLLLGRSKMPNGIAPAWKPEGPRQTV